MQQDPSFPSSLYKRATDVPLHDAKIPESSAVLPQGRPSEEEGPEKEERVVTFGSSQQEYC